MTRSLWKPMLPVILMLLALAVPTVPATPSGHGGCTPACVDVDYCVPPYAACLEVVDLGDETIWGRDGSPAGRAGVPSGDGSSCQLPDCAHVYHQEGDCTRSGCVRIHVHVHVHVAILL